MARRQTILAAIICGAFGLFLPAAGTAAPINSASVPLPPSRPLQFTPENATTELPADAPPVTENGASLPLCKGTDNRKWDNCVGTFQIENLGEYSGEIRNHRPHGSGVFKSLDGSVYQGEFREGIPAGKGRYTSQKGGVYIGEFADGVANGEGSEQAADGTRYTGSYANGVRDGKGKITFPDGRAFEGEFKADRIEGYGTFTFPKGDTYTGVLYNNEPTDRGIYRFANGDRYVGVYKDFKPSGQGVLTFASGQKLIGAFVDGAPKGPGVLYDANGDLIFEGEVSGFDSLDKARATYEAKRAATASKQSAALATNAESSNPSIASQTSDTAQLTAPQSSSEPKKPDALGNAVVVKDVIVPPLSASAPSPMQEAAGVSARTDPEIPTTPTLAPQAEPTPSSVQAPIPVASAGEAQQKSDEVPPPVLTEPAPLSCKRTGDLLVSFIACQMQIPQAQIDDIRFAGSSCKSGREYLADYDQSRQARWYDVIRLFKAYFYFRPFDYRGVHRYREEVHFLVSGCKAGAFTIGVNGVDWTWPEQGEPVRATPANP